MTNVEEDTYPRIDVQLLAIWLPSSFQRRLHAPGTLGHGPSPEVPEGGIVVVGGEGIWRVKVGSGWFIYDGYGNLWLTIKHNTVETEMRQTIPVGRLIRIGDSL